MPPNSELPRKFSPEVLEALQQAFEDVWAALHAHLQPESEYGKEMGITLSRTLVSLAAEGITDRQELRRRALENLTLMPR